MSITVIPYGSEANAAASGSISVPLPDDLIENDIILVVAGCYGDQTLSCSGYTKKAEYTAGTTGVDETTATLFWKRHSGSESYPTVTGATDSITAQCFAFRGVDTGADPWDAFDAGLASGTATNVTFPSLTTSTNGAMAVLLAATANNNVFNAGYVGYGALDSDTGMEYLQTILGSDASNVFMHGVQAAAGDIGAPYAAKQSITSQRWVSMAGALKPAATATFHLNADLIVDLIPDAAITALTPAYGLVGTSVTITGTDFRAGGTVLFGSTAATQTSWSDTSIVVTVPDVAVGATAVTVTPTDRQPSAASSFNVYEALPDPDPTNTNPLFDETFVVSVARAALPRTYHDFTSVVLPGMRFGNTNPGGFGDCTFRIEATAPNTAFVHDGHTLAKGDRVRVAHGTYATVLYEGEVTNDVTCGAVEDGFGYYEVTCAGQWWKAGRRGDFCRTWGDDDPGQWFELTSGSVFQTDTDGKVEVRFEEGQTARNGASKSLYYWLDGGMGDPDAQIDVLLGEIAGNVVDKDSAAWHADIYSSDSPWGTWTFETSWSNTTIAAGSAYRNEITAGAKALRLRLWVDGAASTGTTADRYIRLSRFSVISNSVTRTAITGISVANPTVVSTVAAHGLQTGDRIFLDTTGTTPRVFGWYTVTRTGETTLTVPVNVSANPSPAGLFYCGPRLDDALCDIAVTTGLATTISWEAPIGLVNWGLNARPHMTRADAIELFAGTNVAPIDYGFWENDTFRCAERPTTPPVANDYLIDTDLPGIDFDVKKNTEESPTHVKVLYLLRNTDGATETVPGSGYLIPDATQMAVYRPSEPDWDDASVVLEVWDQWADLSLETGQAEDIGDQILAWLDANAYVGTVTVAAPTLTLRAGGEKLAIYARGGDYVQDNAATMARSMVTSVDIDRDSGVVTIGIGETRSDFVARIKPRAVASPPSRRLHTHLTGRHSG